MAIPRTVATINTKPDASSLFWSNADLMAGIAAPIVVGVTQSTGVLDATDNNFSCLSLYIAATQAVTGQLEVRMEVVDPLTYVPIMVDFNVITLGIMPGSGAPRLGTLFFVGSFNGIFAPLGLFRLNFIATVLNVTAISARLFAYNGV